MRRHLIVYVDVNHKLLLSTTVQHKHIHSGLIERSRAGDSKAQMELYKAYYRAMYNTCYRFMKDSMEAEDMMQESFLAAFTKLDTYKGEVSFGAWLKRIVINKCIDALKKRKVDLVYTDSYENNAGADETVTETDYEYTVEQVKEAIESLPDGYRLIVSLYLLEGYDHEEIAEVLSISSSTSRSQFLRAKKKLKEILKAR